MRDARELLDHALRHGRREERLARGDDADRREQVLGRLVLENEAARAHAQRLEDVLVEVERREDEHARRGIGGEDPARRLETVELGHANVHQDTVGCEARGLVDRLEPVARLGDDLDVALAIEQHAEAGAHQSTGRRRRARGCSRTSTPDRQAGVEDEAAVRCQVRPSSRRRRS